MLVASARFVLGSGTMRSRLVLGRGLRAHVVERRGLVFDTRFLPPSTRPSKSAVITVVLSGTFELLEPSRLTFNPPCVLVTSEDVVEGAHGKRAITFRSYGDPFLAMDLRVPLDDVLVEGLDAFVSIAPSKTLLEDARRLGNAFDDDDDEQTANAARALLETLVADDILRAEMAAVAPRDAASISRIWTALRPFAERVAVLSTLGELSVRTGTSLRQLARDLADLTETVGQATGWRETTRRLRLKLAVLGLSEPSAPISEVAKSVGYGSVEAMARAFRDAGLASPKSVRAALTR